ncbi:MAG TPA: tetratricopeptide repeat protein [Phycisphaerales bacterium]|nr:tetratricopeptide repeat protein [Phycisphaerales bacterium]
MNRVLLIGLVFALTLGACARGTRSAGPSLEMGAQSAARARELAAQAQAASKGGNLDKSIDLYRMSLAQSPDFGTVWHELGIVLMKRRADTDLVQAAQALKQAQTLLPSDPTPSYNLGVLYQVQGFEEDALKHYEEALAIDPYHMDALRGAARSGKVLHKSDPAALDRLKRAQMIERDPTWRDLIVRERIRVENDLREASERT